MRPIHPLTLLSLTLLPFAHAEVITGAPFSADAITETTQILADGSSVTHTASSRWYRDNQGRERHESMLDPRTGRAADSSRTPTVVIVDPVAGFTYNLNVLQHTLLRIPIVPPSVIAQRAGAGFAPSIQITPANGPGNGAQLPQIVIQQGGHAEITGPGDAAGPVPPSVPSQPQRRVELLAPSTIEGLRAEGTRTIETVPANRAGNGAPFDIVTEVWTSPELKTDLVNRRSDPRSGDVTFRLTNILRAEPDPKLFEVPEGYTIQEFPSITGGIVTGPGALQPSSVEPGVTVTPQR